MSLARVKTITVGNSDETTGEGGGGEVTTFTANEFWRCASATNGRWGGREDRETEPETSLLVSSFEISS